MRESRKRAGCIRQRAGSEGFQAAVGGDELRSCCPARAPRAPARRGSVGEAGGCCLTPWVSSGAEERGTVPTPPHAPVFQEGPNFHSPPFKKHLPVGKEKTRATKCLGSERKVGKRQGCSAVAQRWLRRVPAQGGHLQTLWNEKRERSGDARLTPGDSWLAGDPETGVTAQQGSPVLCPPRNGGAVGSEFRDELASHRPQGRPCPGRREQLWNGVEGPHRRDLGKDLLRTQPGAAWSRSARLSPAISHKGFLQVPRQPVPGGRRQLAPAIKESLPRANGRADGVGWGGPTCRPLMKKAGGPAAAFQLAWGEAPAARCHVPPRIRKKATAKCHRVCAARVFFQILSVSGRKQRRGLDFDFER